MQRCLAFCSVLVVAAEYCLISQPAYTFIAYQQTGKTIAELDSLYPPALATDSHYVFRGREEEFGNAWRSMLQDFGTYLKRSGFAWSEPLWCFQRVYFDRNGRVEVFLYNFKEGALSKKQATRFHKLVNAFLRDYKLVILQPASSAFSQCGPVTYMPSDD